MEKPFTACYVDPPFKFLDPVCVGMDILPLQRLMSSPGTSYQVVKTNCYERSFLGKVSTTMNILPVGKR